MFYLTLAPPSSLLTGTVAVLKMAGNVPGVGACFRKKQSGPCSKGIEFVFLS